MIKKIRKKGRCSSIKHKTEHNDALKYIRECVLYAKDQMLYIRAVILPWYIGCPQQNALHIQNGQLEGVTFQNIFSQSQ